MMDKSILSRSLDNSIFLDMTLVNFDPSDAIKEQRVMYSALKARKEALEETLKAKTDELKKLCIKEGELTGILPLDYPSLPGESLPTIRKRVGTAFSLQSKVDDDTDAASKIELEYELQKQITSAALRLSQDKSVSKYVRKQRKQSYQKAHAKLKEMEKKLAETKGPAMDKPKPGFLSPAVPSYDGRYSITHETVVQQEYDLDMAFCDDMSIIEHTRAKPSVTSRLYKSFRVRYLGKNRMNKSHIDRTERHSFMYDTSILNATTNTCHGLKSSSSTGSTSSSSSSSCASSSSSAVSKDTLFSPMRASWHQYCYEKMCHEMSLLNNVESEV